MPEVYIYTTISLTCLVTIIPIITTKECIIRAFLYLFMFRQKQNLLVHLKEEYNTEIRVTDLINTGIYRTSLASFFDAFQTRSYKKKKKKN